MKIISVLLNPTIDEIFEIKGFHVGGTFKAGKSMIYPVGKAISFSLGIRELTNKKDIIKVIAFIGNSEISLYSRFLQAKNIPHEFVSVNGTTRSNKTFNDPVNNTTTHIRSIGFDVMDSDIHQLRELILENLEYGDYIIFSGSIPPGAPNDIYFKLIKECKIKGAITILDSSNNALTQGIKANPKIIKPNLEELAQITNEKEFLDFHSLNSEENLLKIVNIAKPLLNDDLEIILITLGNNGALCLTKNEALYGSLSIENAYDTVGSGDSFLAGFIINHVFKENINDCFRNALACGAANTFIPGPGIFKQEDVKRLIKDVNIKKIN